MVRSMRALEPLGHASLADRSPRVSRLLLRPTYLYTYLLATSEISGDRLEGGER